MNYWLVKSEPHKYSWDQFLKDGQTFWDGVRNFQARNNLKLMKKDDLIFFYHSNVGKNIVGIAKIVKEFYQDPTSDDPNWVAVDLEPLESLPNPVSLEVIKKDEFLKDIALIRQSRLSVMGLSEDEFNRILLLAQSKQ